MSKAVITGSAANRHIKEVIHVITGVDVDTVKVNTEQPQQTEQPLLTARIDNQIAVVKKYVDDKVAERATKAELASESASIRKYVDDKVDNIEINGGTVTLSDDALSKLSTRIAQLEVAVYGLDVDVSFITSERDDNYSVQLMSDYNPDDMYFRAQIGGYYGDLNTYIYILTPWSELPSDMTHICSCPQISSPSLVVYLCPDITAQKKTVYYCETRDLDSSDNQKVGRIEELMVAKAKAVEAMIDSGDSDATKTIYGRNWWYYGDTLRDEKSEEGDCSFRTLGNGDFRIELLPADTEIVGVYYSDQSPKESTKRAATSDSTDAASEEIPYEWKREGD